MMVEGFNTGEVRYDGAAPTPGPGAKAPAAPAQKTVTNR
jgi:hypothetical protein